MKSMTTGFLVLLFIGACSAKEPASDEKKLTVSEVGSVKDRGDKVPDFAWKDASGKTVTFDKYHSKVTVLNFWATWCGPCRREIPDLIAIHKEYADKGVRVIGISVDRGPGILDDVKEFAAKYSINYPVVVDNGDLEQIYGNIRAIPTTFIINKDGKIVDRLIGMRSKEVFLKSILPHVN